MTFPYFGRKATLAPLYPTPQYPLVIEPFAGSLAYTIHHRPESAVGIERDDRVVALWHRLATMPWWCGRNTTGQSHRATSSITTTGTP